MKTPAITYNPHGMEPWHSGGGLWVLRKEIDGFEVMHSEAEGMGLPLEGDELFGVYSLEEGDELAYAETLELALAIAKGNAQ